MFSQTLGKAIKISLTILITIICTVSAGAGILMTEYESNFDLEDAIFSSKLAITDFDSDGRDDIILSDDYGSFHIFALHDTVFQVLWISDPLDPALGTIKWLGAIGGEARESRIYLLDSNNQLHRFSYEGYLFRETAQWDINVEGYLIDAAVIRPVGSEADELLLLTILPGQKFEVVTYFLSGEQAITTHGVGVTAPLLALPGFAVWGGGIGMALMTIREDISPEGDPVQSYLLKIVTKEDKTLEAIKLEGFDPHTETIAQVVLASDGRLEAIGFSLAEEVGFLNLRIWHEKEDNIAEPGDWNVFTGHRGIATGDIDGDGQVEFVTLGIDGLVRVLGEETLTYSIDGRPITPTLPAIIDQGEIYQGVDFLNELGIDILESAGKIVFRRGDMELTFVGDPGEWLPEVGDNPPLKIITDPYGNKRYPLSRLCIDIGFAYRYRTDLGVVEVLS